MPDRGESKVSSGGLSCRESIDVERVLAAGLEFSGFSSALGICLAIL
jgi:hypothetical protein